MDIQPIRDASAGVVGEEVLLSVCVITYNHARYIAQALDSVLAQKTSFSFEILIGEDGSVDGTAEIVKAYQNKYPDLIRVISRERKSVAIINGRATGIRNIIETFSEARGRYIATLEGDDYWLDSNKLERQVKLLESNRGVAVCGHLARIVDEQSNDMGMAVLGRPYPEMFSMRHVLEGSPVHFNSWVIRRSCLPALADIPLIMVVSGGDNVIMAALMRRGGGCCIPEVMSAYRSHSTGCWTSLGLAQKMVDGLQFVVLSYRYVKGGEFFFWLHAVGGAWSKTIMKILVESGRKRSLAALVDFFGILWRRREGMGRGTSVLCVVLGVIYMPVVVVLYALRRVRNRRLLRLAGFSADGMAATRK